MVALTHQGQEAWARAPPLWAEAQARLESQMGTDYGRLMRAHLDEIVAAAIARGRLFGK